MFGTTINEDLGRKFISRTTMRYPPGKCKLWNEHYIKVIDIRCLAVYLSLCQPEFLDAWGKENSGSKFFDKSKTRSQSAEGKLQGDYY